ncbi:hypothetical protein BWK59_10705 [Flavobacterium davisii]|uniref:Lipoprotein n=1 Tax=Flavobacterium davisii TaxID=2906077 RepID=A0A246GGX7_9FLAO|nr:hypothetical protein [Flavobacterium davisii]OWP83394.1 hypothetical protein BWK59_10680 [Flavobacterium davisii]OWP83399.1 hypothetical protein BWK59_10705 [Flavobacterium davisii]
MKKLFVILFIGISFIGCKNYAYIFDEKEEKPLEGVLVIDLNNNSNRTYTDKNGKFSFTECGNVLIQKKGFKSDTLKDYGCKPDPYCFKGKVFYMKRINK